MQGRPLQDTPRHPLKLGVVKFPRGMNDSSDARPSWGLDMSTPGCSLRKPGRRRAQGASPGSEAKAPGSRNKREGAWVPEYQAGQSHLWRPRAVAQDRSQLLSSPTLHFGVSFRAGTTTISNAALKNGIQQTNKQTKIIKPVLLMTTFC